MQKSHIFSFCTSTHFVGPVGRLSRFPSIFLHTEWLKCLHVYPAVNYLQFTQFEVHFSKAQPQKRF